MYVILIVLIVILIDILRIRSGKPVFTLIHAAFYATFLYIVAMVIGLISFDHLIMEYLLLVFLLIDFYIIKTGIDDVSPTLLIYRMTDSLGVIPINVIESSFMRERTIQKRLDTLVDDGFVELIEGKYYLTKKGALATKIWDTLRRLF